MPKTMEKLGNSIRVTKPGRYSDGGGLYLKITDKDAKSWEFAWRDKSQMQSDGDTRGKLRWRGLGSEKSLGLAEAREEADRLNRLVKKGQDPFAAALAESQRPTFGMLADEILDAEEKSDHNDKSKARLRRSLAEGGFANALRKIRIDQVTPDDVLKVLKPIWLVIHPTAEKVHSHIFAVMVAGHPYGADQNLAAWKATIRARLPKVQRSQNHHPALDYEEIPAFMAKLRALTKPSARTLEFLVLTGGRSAEIREAVWGEINLPKGVWTIPAGRMKSKRVHDVPLSSRALALLSERPVQGRGPGDLVFPGAKHGAPLSGTSFKDLLIELGHGDVTAHGFRSTFRDWAEDGGGFDYHLAELAIAHAAGDGMVRSYRRRTGVERRRMMMEAWAAYCALDPVLLAEAIADEAQAEAA